MQIEKPVIVWFRRDLRLRDNPALAQAVASRQPVLPLYVQDDEGEGAWPDGAASRWWLHHSLSALADALAGIGSRLILRRGSSLDALLEICRVTGSTAVYWNRRYEPAIIARDTEIKKRLHAEGVQARSFNGALLHSPLSVANKSSLPFRVFTPFWNCIQKIPLRSLEAEPESLGPQVACPLGPSVSGLNLLPRIPWDAGFPAQWSPGEAGAQSALSAFAERVSRYEALRDVPSAAGVSRLSPHLHFGELSPLQVWQAMESTAAEPYRRQLAWREFGHHLLFHFPNTSESPMRPEYERFPWKRDEALVRAWQRGRTGIPFVDAGMRELWATGWMHNRVRMVASSYLVKHLLQPWQAGAAWFWDTLVDADLANNSMGWQWVAGCGADAAPYFRVFNPVGQGERFDPTGEYTRRWLPELASLPDKWLFQPWLAPADVLRKAGVRLGEDYPKPIVLPEEGRAAALAAYAAFKEARLAS